MECRLCLSAQSQIGANLAAGTGIQSSNFLTFKKPRNRFQEINFSSLSSLAGRCDNPIPTRYTSPHRLFKNSSTERHNSMMFMTDKLESSTVFCLWCTVYATFTFSLAQVHVLNNYMYNISRLLLLHYTITSGHFFKSCKKTRPSPLTQQQDR
jgi:hypothetical protein